MLVYGTGERVYKVKHETVLSEMDASSLCFRNVRSFRRGNLRTSAPSMTINETSAFRILCDSLLRSTSAIVSPTGVRTACKFVL